MNNGLDLVAQFIHSAKAENLSPESFPMEVNFLKVSMETRGSFLKASFLMENDSQKRESLMSKAEKAVWWARKMMSQIGYWI